MAKEKMLPRQAWDEINVSNERVQTTQSVKLEVPKELRQLLKEMKKAKGNKKNGRK